MTPADPPRPAHRNPAPTHQPRYPVAREGPELLNRLAVARGRHDGGTDGMLGSVLHGGGQRDDLLRLPNRVPRSPR